MCPELTPRGPKCLLTSEYQARAPCTHIHESKTIIHMKGNKRIWGRRKKWDVSKSRTFRIQGGEGQVEQNLREEPGEGIRTPAGKETKLRV